MNIAIAINEAYVPYAYVLLYSIFKNNDGKKIKIFLLQDDVEKESLNKIRDLAESNGATLEIPPIHIEKTYSIFYEGYAWPKEICYRLKLPEILPEEIDRILYLDADMIVQKSLEPLYNMDFEGNELIAAKDIPSVMDKEGGKSGRNKRPDDFFSLFDKEEYFNSGMLLMNLDKLRGKYTLEEYIKHAEKFDYKLPFPDQDILNYVHRGRVKFVEPWIYNYTSIYASGPKGAYDYRRVKDEVVIVHFAVIKPWHGGDHVHYDLEKIWWEYALETEFKEKFLTEYMWETIEDTNVRNYVANLEQSNMQLSKDLNTAIESFNKLAAACKKISG